MRITPEDLEIFMEVKQAEIALIIENHKEEDPQQIARAIVEELDYYQLPLSLLVRRSTNEN